jgi:hypothetical protein
LRWGEFSRLRAEDGVYAFQRTLGHERTVTILNADEQAKDVELEILPKFAGNPTILAGSADIHSGEQLRFRIPARASVVFGLESAPASS